MSLMKCLEDCRGIGKSKRHYQVVIMSRKGVESHLH